MSRHTFRRVTPSSFRGRIMLSTVGVVTVVMLVAGTAVQLILGFAANRDIESRLTERAAGVITLIDDASHTDLSVPTDALPLGVRVYDDRGRPVGGVMAPKLQRSAEHLATTDIARSVTADDESRLRGVPFTTSAGDKGVVVVSQEIAPYERSEFYALMVTLVFGGLIVASTAVVTRRVTTQALKPVSRMAQSAAEWSEHDLAQRFDLPPSDDELAALGETLDHLLDRVAAAIRAEQRLTAELAHELRTPLTAIQGSADLALMRGIDDEGASADLEQISTSARAMADVITALLDVARETSTGAFALCTADMLVEPLAALVPESLRFVNATTHSVARIAAPKHLVVRALAPLVDNAVRHARSEITLSALDGPDWVSLSIVDDGPGSAEGLGAALAEPGTSTSGSTGLGLGIVQRVARSLGGELTVRDSESGAAFVLRIPRG